jgi:homoserine O-acetyltransferase/O-succinyltransferase
VTSYLAQLNPSVAARLSATLLSIALLFGLLLAGSPSRAQAPAVQTPQVVELPDFRFASGEMLPKLVVQYATIGTPRRDAAGNIVNAILNPHGWSGDYSQTIRLAKDLIGPGRLLDPERYFIVFPTAVGSPGSFAPSTSGLGPKFPKYAVQDMVTAQHRLVTEHLGIRRLAGVVGISMGGFQTLQWATQYPDMMDWAIPITAHYKNSGRNIGIFGVMSYTIRTDPAYREGRYTEQPREAMRRAFMGTYLWFFGERFYDAQFKTEADALKGLAGLGSDRMDANDIVWRNDALNTFNLEKEMSKVKAKVLVVGVEEDELFPGNEAIRPLAAAIPGARSFVYSSPLGHVGGAVHIAKAMPAMVEFVQEVERTKR